MPYMSSLIVPQRIAKQTRHAVCINFRLTHLSLIAVSVIFISCKPPVDPVELVVKFIKSVETTGVSRTRFALSSLSWPLSVWLLTIHHADILIASFRCQEIVSLTFLRLTRCVARYSNLSSTNMGKEILRYFCLTFSIFLSSWNCRYPVQNWIANEEPHDNTAPDSHPTCCSMYSGRSQCFLG